MAERRRDEGARGRRGREAIRAEVDSGVAELLPDRERGAAWTLLLDGAPQSHVDLADPTWLEFDYVRRLARVADLTAPPGRPLRACHLGGGGMTLARYVAATRPRSVQRVVEHDARLVELVRRDLPLDRTWRVTVGAGDAREGVARAREGAFDLVVCDVFAAGRTPAHLTTVEFTVAVARALAEDGVYAANVADGAPLAFARSQLATVAEVLPHVCVVADPGVLRGRHFGNLVVVASRRELPVAALTRLAAADSFPGRVLHGEELRRFVAGAPPVTDAAARPSPAPPAGTFAAVRSSA